ncbi:CG12050 [Drosophila busckii]|uniref:CG12050 n=1 Tax=Drosophila busckii TaxID=30019 RepID=A0A0M3QUB8_DROBS|nr:CG12050 [Drosophila busckii]
MNFDDEDKLELQHLAGGNIVQHAPVFSTMGRFVFIRCGLKVQVFVTSTGELTRELTDATSTLISLEMDLKKQPDLLYGCTNTGQLLLWHWRTGVLQNDLQLNLGQDGLEILTFNLLDLYQEGESATAFVTAKRKSGEKLFWFLVNTSTGNRIHVNCGLKLKVRTPMVDVSKGAFKYILFSQGHYVYVLNYKTWQFARYQNQHKEPVTCVRMSPNEEMAATGDQHGRIYIWRNIDDAKHVQATELHWHNTAVTSIAFTPTGTSLYSAGHESVLVKWNLKKNHVRDFLPRMSSIVRHIVISDGNEHVLCSTDDNALQFISPDQMSLQSTLQHFTYALPDKTGKSMFPIGLCLNPRTNTLVLNGRIGHLQFFSAYQKSLLYNLRVVDTNINSQEANRIIYNINITCAAFNIDWMATGEVYNDHRNFVELRLKFWQYQEKMQSYVLNTNIELPHEQGFQAIAFSNQFKVNNLRCASAGKDNVIKLWTLGDTENIYKRGGTMWSCVAQTQYKQQTLGSICFSQDGSLLAAGYGSALVLYDAGSLSLLHALSTAAGLSGVMAKAQLRLAQTPVNGCRKELAQQRQALWQLLQKLLNNNNDPQLVEQAKQLIASAPSVQVSKTEQKPTAQESIFKHIMQMSELDLHQKLQLLRRFDIECQVPNGFQRRLFKYLKVSLADPIECHQRLLKLNARLLRLQPRERFKAKQRLSRVCERRQSYEKIVKNDLLTLFSVLHIDETTKPKAATPKSTPLKRKRNSSASAPAAAATQPLIPGAPFQSMAQISQVQFGAGAQAHLVAVCTESRVLIWNLMTLRLQAGLKLSVRQLAFDPLTNLIAAVTRNDELHVFQPNVPLPVYQRRQLPKLFGLVWLPRRQPKQSSINVDWQAQSTLHMLTEDKEIVYLATPGQSTTDDAPAPISFAQPAQEQLQQYATFGSFVAKQQMTEMKDLPKSSGPLIVGRGVHSAVNALVNLSAHTMPAMSLICGEFIKTLLTPAETEAAETTPHSNGQVNGNGLHHLHEESDEEEEAEQLDRAEETAVLQLAETTEMRKKLLVENEQLKQQNSKEYAQQSLDARLQRMAKLEVELSF